MGATVLTTSGTVVCSVDVVARLLVTSVIVGRRAVTYTSRYNVVWDAMPLAREKYISKQGI